MKILGEKKSSFPHFVQEKGLFGVNDTLKGKPITRTWYECNMFGETKYSQTMTPTLYLHLFKNCSSTFTGYLREYLLPWRWQAVFLKEGMNFQRALVCTAPLGKDLPEKIKLALGKSKLIAHLIEKDSYEEIQGKEFIKIDDGITRSYEILHPWGKFFGSFTGFIKGQICQIYRKQNFFSFLTYYFLKIFSSALQEVTLGVKGTQEKVLIKKEDREILQTQGFLK